MKKAKLNSHIIVKKRSASFMQHKKSMNAVQIASKSLAETNACATEAQIWLLMKEGDLNTFGLHNL